MFVHMDPDSAVCASVCVLAVARVTLNLGFPRQDISYLRLKPYSLTLFNVSSLRLAQPLSGTGVNRGTEDRAYNFLADLT